MLYNQMYIDDLGHPAYGNKRLIGENTWNGKQPQLQGR